MTQGLIYTSQETIDALHSLGLTLYEAKAYVALLSKHPVHAQEISRRSGVPGPKVYETLKKMAEKGIVAVLEGTPLLYEPLPPEEFLRRKRREFTEKERRLRGDLARLSEPPVDIVLWQMTNYDALIGKALHLLEAARENILASLWSQQGHRLLDALLEAQGRGVRVISIQFGPEIMEVGKVFRHIQTEMVQERHSGEMTIVVDQSVGLFMSRPPEGEWNGFWTANPGVVKLMTNYIRHDIYSNKLIRRFDQDVRNAYGEQFQALLDLETD